MTLYAYTIRVRPTQPVCTSALPTHTTYNRLMNHVKRTMQAGHRLSRSK